MKIILLTLSFLFHQQIEDNFKLQNGDLIFQESCSNDIGDAIKEVTTSIDEYHFTHVGIVYINKNDSIFVLEATHPKVVLTPLSDYLYPEKSNGCFPKSVVGRLKDNYQIYIPQALKEGVNLIGKDYDSGYILNNDKYYCSELIYDILLKANKGKPIFQLNTMTFISPETGEVSDSWKKYFESISIPVPEGEPGINPGAMSKANVIDIIHYY